MDFSECRKVTDVSASAVAVHCKKLVYLGLLNCSISEEYIELIIRNNPKLLNIQQDIHGATYSMLHSVSPIFPENVRKYFH